MAGFSYPGVSFGNHGLVLAPFCHNKIRDVALIVAPPELRFHCMFDICVCTDWANHTTASLMTATVGEEEEWLLRMSSFLVCDATSYLSQENTSSFIIFIIKSLLIIIIWLLKELGGGGVQVIKLEYFFFRPSEDFSTLAGCPLLQERPRPCPTM